MQTGRVQGERGLWWCYLPISSLWSCKSPEGWAGAHKWSFLLSTEGKLRWTHVQFIERVKSKIQPKSWIDLNRIGINRVCMNRVGMNRNTTHQQQVHNTKLDKRQWQHEGYLFQTIGSHVCIKMAPHMAAMVLSSITSITVWLTSATKTELRRLQRIVQRAERITGITLSTLQKLYSSRAVLISSTKTTTKNIRQRTKVNGLVFQNVRLCYWIRGICNFAYLVSVWQQWTDRLAKRELVIWNNGLGTRRVRGWVTRRPIFPGSHNSLSINLKLVKAR